MFTAVWAVASPQTLLTLCRNVVVHDELKRAKQAQIVFEPILNALWLLPFATDDLSLHL